MTVVQSTTMQAQEDLVALFSKNLTLEPAQQAQPPREEPKIVYISQHYNHSAHLAQQQQQQQPQEKQKQGQGQEQEQPVLHPRPASEPPQPEHAAVETILRDHAVDTSCLSSAQLQLFKAVEGYQQLRLIELWRMSPPTSSRDNPTLAYSFTTVDQEELLARLRYEERQRQAGQMVMSLDGTPLTPIQAGDGRWLPTQSAHDIEPYMASGYEDMARREYEESARRAYAEAMAERSKDIYVDGPNYNRATDPVYNTTNNGVGWNQQAHMEDQYGRMMQFRSDDEEML